MSWGRALRPTGAPQRNRLCFFMLYLVISSLLCNGENGVKALQLLSRTKTCAYLPAAVSAAGASSCGFIIHSLTPARSSLRTSTCYASSTAVGFPQSAAAPAAAAPAAAPGSGGGLGESAATLRLPPSGAACSPASSTPAATAAATPTSGAPAAAPAAAGTAPAADDEWVAVVQIVHAPRHFVVAVLVQEALQCLLWGSDSDVQVTYELSTSEQLQQQQQQQLLPEQQQAIAEGAVEVRVFFENRSGAALFSSSSSNGNRSAFNSSRGRIDERGRVLVWSLLGVAAAADLIVPAAARLPDGAAAIRSAAAALEQQQQQQLQQQELLLQRCRAALPMRQGALWSFLLCAEVAAKLRHKAGEDVLPLAVQGVQSAPLLPFSWCTLGHSLRLRGRLWESSSCYRVAASLCAAAAPVATASVDPPAPATPRVVLAAAPRAALAAAAASAATVPGKLIAALDETLLRARRDPKELRRALPTLIKAEVEAPWGFAVDANPPEVGGLFVAYVVENSKAEKAGLMPGDQIVIANNSIVLGLPVERCLASLRARQRPGLLQQQERQQLLPLQLEVYRGSFPVLYGAPALAALQRLGAVKELLSSNSSAEQQYRQQQQTPPVHTPAGSLNSLLQGADTRHSEFF